MTPRNDTLRLASLLPGVSSDTSDVPVRGIAYDSRSVSPGDVFFALPGAVADGTTFVPQAISRGASAVVAEKSLTADVPVIVVPDARKAMAEAAARFFSHPDRDVRLVAIIGTNGKSTIGVGLQAIWTHADRAAGMIGTISYQWGNQVTKASRTTPESPDLYRMIDGMRTDGVTDAAVEVSSHAIALDRVWGVRFAGAVFTNLTRDHLDYHKTIEEYRRVKTLPFARLEADGAFAAINVDDPSAPYFLEAAGDARIVRYGLTQQGADVSLAVLQHSMHGTTGELIVEGQRWPFASPLWGRFNHANLAAMAAAAWGTGVGGEQIAAAFAHFEGIPGRLERIPSDAPFDVLVDFAHTPDALDAALSAVRPLVSGRVLVVFGCGGDRDRGKRPEMARAVERWADQIYLTSDNPRSEDPKRIIADVKAGFSTGTPVWCDPERVRAIERSMTDANPGDLVLLCGKGHEETQEIAGTFHRYSDRETAVQILAANGHSPQTPRGAG